MIISNIYKKAPNLDLPLLINHVNSITKKEGIKISNTLIESIDDSSIKRFLTLSFVGKHKDSNFTLRRSFSIIDKEIIVSHDAFVLPEYLQGRGISKSINKTLLNHYQKSNVSKIILYANKDIGGYTWAKYGFISRDKTEITSIINKGFKDKKITKSQQESLLEIAEKSHKEKGYINMKYIADKPYSKKLLLGSNWDGELDLNNPEQLNILIDYLNK